VKDDKKEVKNADKMKESHDKKASKGLTKVKETKKEASKNKDKVKSDLKEKLDKGKSKVEEVNKNI